MPAAAPPSRPPWAAAFGADTFGPFADLDVGGVVQRFRWVPPGVSTLGAPADEEGRLPRDGLPRPVRLRRGLWVADTPVTQALARALGHRDDSRFADPERPAEQLAWVEAVACCARLSARAPATGPDGAPWVFRLPTEAEWEVACRAGTTGATYAGPLGIRGLRDAPGLDPIAWFGGNSGVDYDLEVGHPSADWPERLHPHARAGTRRVREKAPNPWGLYDTLGNVWEWCMDAVTPRAPLRDRPVADPLGRRGRERALRGGAWHGAARLCRAAARHSADVWDRSDDTGFRLCWGPALAPAASAPVPV